MTNKTQHTPKCATINECQSNHSHAKGTEKLRPIATSGKAEEGKASGFEYAQIADQSKLKKTGNESKQKPSEPMVGNAPAVGNQNLPFSLSTTPTGTGQNNDDEKAIVDGDSTNGSRSKDIQKKDTDFSAGTAIVGASSGNAPTKGKATPGPWKVEPYKFSKRGSWVSHPASVQAADGHWIANNISGHDFQGSAMANARLIANAPDLLAACAKALDYLGRIEEASEGAELRDLLRSAIAKAEAQP